MQLWVGNMTYTAQKNGVARTGRSGGPLEAVTESAQRLSMRGKKFRRVLWTRVAEETKDVDVRGLAGILDVLVVSAKMYIAWV